VKSPFVNADRYPMQGRMLGRRVIVVFNYDTSAPLRGTVIRDDVSAPNRTVIQLDNGWVTLGTECQYRSVRPLRGKL
jgi:hypothetical protein